MPSSDLDHEDLIKTLTHNFNILADEVQLLSDKKIILEHKLRFAHEQYQYLADKYASGDPEISSTLAKLQLPPDLQVSAPGAGFVPLPQRSQTNSKQQTAVAIRDGRKAAQRLLILAGKSVGSTASGRSISGTSSNVRLSARRTSLSTVLEQDFTVPGKKSSLFCPFSRPVSTTKPTMHQSPSQGSGTLNSDRPLTPSDMKDQKPHHSSDPICAALYAETMTSPPPSATGSAAKCPIRFLDQHSPEEVARYFETHKHEIPRSHEVCVRRYQRNEDDIRKLDAKYGNLVSMIQGLGQKHQPMLPLSEVEEDMELERTSNERVENWAQAVSADGIDNEHEMVPTDEDDRESRFDRPLKEIRVGESPSRPWGISVPILEPPEGQRPVSPPPAPVSHNPVGKCPFGHGQNDNFPEQSGHSPKQDMQPDRPTAKFPFSQNAKEEALFTQPQPQPRPAPAPFPQPAFIQPPKFPKSNGMQPTSGIPQMVFTGPVFIGYPMEQALAFMQQWKNMQ